MHPDMPALRHCLVDQVPPMARNAPRDTDGPDHLGSYYWAALLAEANNPAFTKAMSATVK
jgi:hypothetical protein